LDGYVVTDDIDDRIRQLADGLRPESGKRAWRITGNYGSGKSSFALLLLTYLESRRQPCRVESQGLLIVINLRARSGLLPVLITGTQERLASAICRALCLALSTCEIVVPSDNSDPATISDVESLRVPYLVCERAPNGWSGERHIAIIDEMGKFLEYAVLHPFPTDVYFLTAVTDVRREASKIPFL